MGGEAPLVLAVAPEDDPGNIISRHIRRHVQDGGQAGRDLKPQCLGVAPHGSLVGVTDLGTHRVAGDEHQLTALAATGCETTKGGGVIDRELGSGTRGQSAKRNQEAPRAGTTLEQIQR